MFVTWSLDLLLGRLVYFFFFFFQAEDGIRDVAVTGVQTCALPIWLRSRSRRRPWRPGWRGRESSAPTVARGRKRSQFLGARGTGAPDTGARRRMTSTRSPTGTIVSGATTARPSARTMELRMPEP